VPDRHLRTVSAIPRASTRGSIRCPRPTARKRTRRSASTRGTRRPRRSGDAPDAAREGRPLNDANRQWLRDAPRERDRRTKASGAPSRTRSWATRRALTAASRRAT
jgi:hypothetical protein